MLQYFTPENLGINRASVSCRCVRFSPFPLPSSDRRWRRDRYASCLCRALPDSRSALLLTPVAVPGRFDTSFLPFCLDGTSNRVRAIYRFSASRDVKVATPMPKEIKCCHDVCLCLGTDTYHLNT